MIDLELPLGKRKPLYRFFEMLPAILSYGSLILLVVLSLLSPLLAAIYLLLVIVTLLIKAAGIAYHTISGRNRLEKAQKVNWHERLQDLEDPQATYAKHHAGYHKAYAMAAHVDNLRLATADPAAFPKPSELYNAVIVAAYNEGQDIIEPTIEALKNSSYDKDHLIIIFAYEQRGGEGIKKTAEVLQKKFGKDFKEFRLVEHPANIPNEVIGKGGNITYAGRYLKTMLDEQGIAYKNVIVTTLDCDNHPHTAYFDYLTYEYIVREDRKHLTYQPISLFFKNIWDAPAAMSVIATGNSFWNIISSMRPQTLRNFASHSQPMEALVEMDFWSVRTIVEDGHQYWRSYFYFGGNYEVIPLFIPIYQDAVLAETYGKTLKAQFVQLRRWAYGASDIPYVATRIFTKDRTVPLFDSFARFVRLVDGHLTLASVSIIVTIGGWLPLWVNPQAYHDVVAHQLPDVIGIIQRVALVGLFITVFLAFKLLPPRPERYKRHRTIFMLLQWVLMPFTSIIYSSFSALYSQTRLFTGRYLDKFDVTIKTTHETRQKYRASQKKRTRRSN
jgi:cellulose synthase/poly-beta-1,6-N-acetylglucosamine synthase-like glycosyltransferase